MKAVILAAGLGTRLRPLTNDTPKILLEVDGEPILSRQVRYLNEQGIHEIGMNTHYLVEQVENACARLSRAYTPLVLFHELELLGTAGALVPMLPWIGGDPFVLLYGDTLTDLDLSLLRMKPYFDAVLACTNMDDDTEGKGIVQLGHSGDVVGFIEKPDAPISGAVFGGVALIRPQVADYFRPGDDLGHDIFPMLARRGRLAAFVDLHARFHDVGTPEALAAAW